jgi:diguanylate cyclase (GGDEF)-like protein/PAS domain S-box-containing protein
VVSAFLTGILDSFSEGVILLDHNRQVVRMNRAARRFLLLDENESLQQSIETLFDLPPELFDPTAVLPELRIPITLDAENGPFQEAELTLQTIEGGWLLTLQDVSSLRRLDLLEERLLYQDAILATTPDQFFVLDRHGRFLYASPAGLKRLNRSLQSLHGRNWQEIGLPDNAGQVLDELLLRVFATGQPASSDISLAAENGPVWFEQILSPYVDASGKTILAVSTMRDITLRYTMEEDLRNSREMYRSLIDTSPDAIVAMDSHGTITLVSQAALDMFNFESKAAAIGHNALDLVDEKDRERALANIELHYGGLANQVILDTRFVLQRQDGEKFTGEVNGSVLRNAAGQSIGVLAIVRDVSEQERAREQLRAANENLQRTNLELENQNRKVTLLSEMGHALLACKSIEAACQVLANTAVQLFNGQAGALYLNDPASDTLDLNLVSAWGENPWVESKINQRHCQALQEHTACFFCVSHEKKPQRGQKASPVQNGPQICIPLIVQNEAIGLFQLHGTARELSDTWMQMAVTIADQVALTIASLRLRDSLHAQAIRDPLTSLYNRRYMEEALQQELARAIRHNHTVGIIMMDIDYFKVFNDTYLHEGGDVLLRRIGHFLIKHVRGEDTACRYGGEEFTIIMPETKIDEVFYRAEFLRKSIGQMRVVHRGQQFHRITVSAGVSVFPQNGLTAAEILRAADTALYRAKQSGRNRTFRADDLRS